jgi:predicted O-methyltransferase YrrM
MHADEAPAEIRGKEDRPQLVSPSERIEDLAIATTLAQLSARHGRNRASRSRHPDGHRWGEFLYALQTGQPPFEKVWGMPLHDYLAAHSDEAMFFNEAMIGFHGAEPPAVAAAFDFSTIRTLVDVGGGTGNLLAAILRTHPRSSGILYDRPHVASQARANLTAAGIADRCSVIEGDFFESVPSGGDASLLSHVLIDWHEEKCLTILSNCRRAMGAHGRLLVVESVLPAGDIPHPGKILDLVMLTVSGGVERSGEEYATLLGRAGYSVSRIVPTTSAVSVIEAMPS